MPSYCALRQSAGRGIRFPAGHDIPSPFWSMHLWPAFGGDIILAGWRRSAWRL